MRWDTGWVDSLPGWAAAGHRWVTGADLPGGFNAQPALRGTGWTGLLPDELRDAAGDERLVLLPDGQTYGCKKLPGRRRLARICRCSPAGGDWRRDRAGGRRLSSISRELASESPASAGRRLQWGLAERRRAGLVRVPDARAAVHAPANEPKKSPVVSTGRLRRRRAFAIRKNGKGARPHGATWLILPVVICLSQRLSHACLSINCFIL